MLRASIALKQSAKIMAKSMWSKWKDEIENVNSEEFELLALTEFAKQMATMRPKSTSHRDRDLSHEEVLSSDKENLDKQRRVQSSSRDHIDRDDYLENDQVSKQKDASIISLGKTSTQSECEFHVNLETTADALETFKQAGINGSNLLFDLRNKLNAQWNISYSEDSPRAHEKDHLHTCQH